MLRDIIESYEIDEAYKMQVRSQVANEKMKRAIKSSILDIKWRLEQPSPDGIQVATDVTDGSGNKVFPLFLDLVRIMPKAREEARAMAKRFKRGVIETERGRATLLHGAVGQKLKMDVPYMHLAFFMEGEVDIEEMVNSDNFDFILTHELAHVDRFINDRLSKYKRIMSQLFPLTGGVIALTATAYMADLADMGLVLSVMSATGAYQVASAISRAIRDKIPEFSLDWKGSKLEMEAVITEATRQVQVIVAEVAFGNLSQSDAMKQLNKIKFFDPSFYDSSIAAHLESSEDQNRREMGKRYEKHLRKMVVQLQKNVKAYLSN